MNYLIVSKAHNWMQALPLSDNMCVCVECGDKRLMNNLNDENPCRAKFESLSSGYSGPIVCIDTGTIVGTAGLWPQLWEGKEHMIYDVRIKND